MSITNMKHKHIRGIAIGRLQLADGIDRNGIKRVQLLRTGTFKHPQAPDGAFTITPDMLLKMKANFDGNARRLDKGEIPLDYGHNTEGEAAGWIQKVDVEDNASLWVEINYTKKAEQAIMDREWRFISADIDFDYEDNETGVKLGAVLLGAGLVNRPHIKSMKAVFSDSGIGEENNNEKPKPEKGYSMTPEEMAKKIGELEAVINQLKAQLGSTDAAKVSAEKSLGDMKAECSGLKEQLKEATAKVTQLTEANEKVAKEAKFSEFLNAGKVVPAQKEAFMGMTLELAEKLFKDAKTTVNLNDNGHGNNGTANNNNGGSNDKKSATDIVEERAAELMKTNSKLKLGEAYRQVLSSDKELNTKYMNETRGVQA
jgi:phage I-like protein